MHTHQEPNEDDTQTVVGPDIEALVNGIGFSLELNQVENGQNLPRKLKSDIE